MDGVLSIRTITEHESHGRNDNLPWEQRLNMQAGLGLENLFERLKELGKVLVGGFVLLMVIAGLFGIGSIPNY